MRRLWCDLRLEERWELGLGLSSLSSAQCVGVEAGSSWDMRRWSKYLLQPQSWEPALTS